MSYPVWQVVTGPQILIAVMGIVHLLIAQFAVGGGLFLVLAEGHTSRHDDIPLKRWLEKFTDFFVVLTLVFGVSTGVGIWFTIGLISPGATERLIGLFLWVWAIEWLFFLVEIISILVYQKTWRSLPEAKHRMVGWVYFISAWLSLFAINGILSFQLTPGRWSEGGSVLQAFFNPGLIPTTLVRTFASFLLAGLYVLVAASWKSDRILKADLNAQAARWITISSVLIAAGCAYAYFTLVHKGVEDGGFIDSLRIAAWTVPITLGVLFAGGLAVAFQRFRLPGRTGSIILLISGMLLIGAFEFAREDLRKPYLIHGIIYANHVPVSAQKRFRKKGFLKSYPYLEKINIDKLNRPAIGRLIFNASCTSCHTRKHGMNAIAPRLNGLDEKFLADTVFHADLTRYRMPPFPGTRKEAAAVASYLRYLAPKGAPSTTGKAVWERRCSPCHTLSNKFRPVSGAFSGRDPATVESLIDNIRAFDKRMPTWTGTQAEKKALSAFLAGTGKEKR